MSDSNKEKPVPATDRPPTNSALSDMEVALEVTDRKLWLALLSVSVLCGFAILWAIFGVLPIQVAGVGVAMSDQGVFTEESSLQGVVREILVEPGSEVEAGDLIMVIEDPQLTLQLQASKIHLDSSRRLLEELQSEVDVEIQAMRDALRQDLRASHYRRERLMEEIESYKRVLEKRRKLFDDGLINADVVRREELNLSQRKIELERTEAHIVAKEGELRRGHRTSEIAQREQEVLRVESEVRLLELKAQMGRVYSQGSGKVLELKVRQGDLVSVGEALTWIEREPKSPERLIFRTYVPVEAGKRVQIGLPAEITVSTVQTQEFGMLRASVTHVSDYAQSPESLSTTLQNAALRQYILGGHPAVLQVEAKPLLDPSTPSGLAWTSGDGPPYPITTGTIVNIKISVEEVSPLEYLFPFWRLKRYFHRPPSKLPQEAA